MTRWIVNPRTHEVRQFVEHAPSGDLLEPGEFFFDAPTAADAAMAGRRHNLAVEALESVEDHLIAKGFKVVGERLEYTSDSDINRGRTACCLLQEGLEALGFEAWREGLGLLVLALRAPIAEDSGSAWVSEIGSDR